MVKLSYKLLKLLNVTVLLQVLVVYKRKRQYQYGNFKQYGKRFFCRCSQQSIFYAMLQKRQVKFDHAVIGKLGRSTILTGFCFLQPHLLLQKLAGKALLNFA